MLLGKPVVSEMNEFPVISDPKNFVANSVLVAMNFWKNRNIFPEKGAGVGGRVKGRSEIFQKFIHFRAESLPLDS